MLLLHVLSFFLGPGKEMVLFYMVDVWVVWGREVRVFLEWSYNGMQSM